MQDEFNNGWGGRVMLHTLQTGGEGLNFSAAAIVILADPWWNPAAESQAIYRAHRMKFAEDMQVIKVMTRATVEETMVDLQKRKTHVIALVMDEQDITLNAPPSSSNRN